MKRLHTTLLLIPLLLAALTACDLASKLVPPIEIGDVLGIGTPEAPTTLTAPAFQNPDDLGTFTPAAIAAIEYDANTRTFPNVELPNLYGFTLDALWVTIGIGDTITLEPQTPTATYPDRFTVTGIEAYIHISDTQNIREPATYHFTESALDLTYTRQGPCTSAQTCNYRATAAPTELENAILFHIPERNGRVVRNLITIITQGGDNQARIKARITADAPNGNLEGLAPTFQISNPSTKVSLGG